MQSSVTGLPSIVSGVYRMGFGDRVGAPGAAAELGEDPPGFELETAERLWLLIDSLGVVENYEPIVAGTKILHHLLLDLAIPMDRTWTSRFFGLEVMIVPGVSASGLLRDVQAADGGSPGGTAEQFVTGRG